MDWRHYLRIRTQEPTFLWRLVIGILVAGALLGILVGQLPLPGRASPRDQMAVAIGRGNPDQAAEILRSMLANPDVTLESLAESLPVLTRQATTDESVLRRPGAQVDAAVVREILQTSERPTQQRAVLVALWNALVESDQAGLLKMLVNAAEPDRGSFYALGVYLLAERNFGEAARAFEAEGRRFEDAEKARQEAVKWYAADGDSRALERLSADPRFRSDVPVTARMKIAVSRGDWLGFWWLIPQGQWERLSIGPLLLALFSGLCWFLIAAQAGQIDSAQQTRWWLCLLAVLLGGLSIWPTLFLIRWQEVVWGLEDNSDLVSGLRYYLVGVGLREEFSKLLLLLPLMPWLVWRFRELEVLIVSACVGLGFAIVENEQYFAMTFGSATLGRFLTANFFHMAATGLIGLAVVRGLRDPRTRGAEAVATFLIVVLAHGLYDATLVVAELQQFNIASPIIYILLSYRFFHELRSLRPDRRETISLTANFLCGVSLVSAAAFVYMSAQFGPWIAGQMLTFEAISMGLMAYMFLREMPNSLIAR